MAEIKDILTRLKNYIDQEDNNEQTRAENAEEALNDKIEQEIADRTADVNAEENRAQRAEANLQDNIDTEAETRSNADNILQNNIDAEETRAQEEESRIETKLDSRIDTEIQDRETDVNAEETRAKTAESSLNAAILAEQERAEGVESQHDQEISQLFNDLSNETQARTNADNDLQEALNQEIADRVADVDAEESRAKEAELSLASDIAAEETRASDEETRIEGKLDDYISSNNQALADEAAARAQADINEETRAKAEELRIETKLDGRVDTEIQDRKNDVDAEEDRAIDAERILQTNITSEENARIAADTALAARIDNLTIAKQGNAEAKVYLKTIKQTNGLIEVELGNFDESISAEGTVSAITAPTTYAVKEYVNTEKDRAIAAETTLANRINTEAGYSIVLDRGDREEDYKFRIKLFAKGDSEHPISTTAWLDLPLESVVVSGRYDNTTKSLILTLQSGQTITIPVGALISGLQSEITLNNPLSSDLVDDTTTNNHKFVTATEKTQITQNEADILNIKSTLLPLKADKSDTYTKATIDGMLDEINDDVEAINTYLDNTPLDVKYESHDGKLGLYKTTRTTTIPTPIVLATTSIADATNASDTKLPTEKAVRAELDSLTATVEETAGTVDTDEFEDNGDIYDAFQEALNPSTEG